MYLMSSSYFIMSILFFFFFNDTATTEIYTLSLHDALPISQNLADDNGRSLASARAKFNLATNSRSEDTRLNSSHVSISYAVFCLKKKKKKKKNNHKYLNTKHQRNAYLILLRKIQFVLQLLQ